ncbi:hypothetical protein L1887_07627 [Cichorium endivia]|nr:hypothetical protein L1887_07627 [Cichorium endivia]
MVLLFIEFACEIISSDEALNKIMGLDEGAELNNQVKDGTPTITQEMDVNANENANNNGDGKLNFKVNNIMSESIYAASLQHFTSDVSLRDISPNCGVEVNNRIKECAPTVTQHIDIDVNVNDNNKGDGQINRVTRSKARTRIEISNDNKDEVHIVLVE